MPKVKLSLIGLSKEIGAGETKKALAALYQKPESHFEDHCKHLFELKKPFVLLKKVDLDMAKKHQNKLGEIGIQCDIEELRTPGALELIPIDEVTTDNKTLCPACEQESDNAEVCDHCEVIIKKYAEQQHIDKMLQEKIASAERSDVRIKQAQKDAAEQLKEKNKKKPKKEPELETEIAAPEEDIFTARVVDKSGSRVLYLAAIGGLAAAIGGGYLAHSYKTSKHQQAEYDLAVTEEAVVTTPGGEPDTQAAIANEPELIIESTAFSLWNSRLADILALQRQLDVLNDEVGMAHTMSGLVSGVQDPLVHTVGEHYLAQLRLSQADQSTDTNLALGESVLNDPVVDDLEVNAIKKRLNNSSRILLSLPTSYERLYAALSLGRTHELLGNIDAAEAAYVQAERYAIETNEQGDLTDLVIAEVIVAEHQHEKGRADKANAHYTAAMTAARALAEKSDKDNEDSDWAIGYVARSEASHGLFVDVHGHVEEISNDLIRGFVMDDISAYASEEDISEINFDSPNSSESPSMQESLDALDANEREFADDPDLMLLFENARKMKSNANKLKKFSNLADD